VPNRSLIAVRGFEVLDAALGATGENIHDTTVAIQGFGNAGANAAVLLSAAGARGRTA
jgi:glutamate dehydrogenase/leucine dehydrogenase